MPEVKQVRRTLDNAQSRLDLGIQKTGVERARTLREDGRVFAAVDEQNAGLLGVDERLREDGILGGGQRHVES
jgi:hypothetical protein